MDDATDVATMVEHSVLRVRVDLDGACRRGCSPPGTSQNQVTETSRVEVSGDGMFVQRIDAEAEFVNRRYLSVPPNVTNSRLGNTGINCGSCML
jgi:hypothetical protein